MKKVSIVTLGCAKNVNDTDNLARLLKSRGFSVESDPSNADAIVVHTCSFIEAAKKESIEAIVQAGKGKNGKKQLIVTGCMVQQHGKEMLAELPEVDAFLGTGQLAQVPDLILKPIPRLLDRRDPGGLTDPDAPRTSPAGSASATLRLSEGCGHPCTFCVIPRLRGGLQSRPEEKIIGEARALAAGGVEEILLIGQDTGDWGRDIYDRPQLPRLLRELKGINGIRWIRVMYMHPFSFTNETLETMAESPDLFPYLDMPLQHIDDDLLTGMKRRLGEHGIRALVETIRNRHPSIALRTTFIVGYPGETDAQFARLLDFVKEGHFDYMGAFPYSAEEGTPAALLPSQIPEDVKRDRHAALMEAYYESSLKKSQARIGGTATVLLEETEGDEVVGRTAMEAPEIDAIVRLPARAAGRGRFVKARITGYDAFEFRADPV